MNNISNTSITFFDDTNYKPKFYSFAILHELKVDELLFYLKDNKVYVLDIKYCPNVDDFRFIRISKPILITKNSNIELIENFFFYLYNRKMLYHFIK